MSQTVRYDAEALQTTMEERVSQYESFKEKLVVLREKMLVVTELGDAFEGEGATNIKDLYRHQSEIVTLWIQLAEQQIAFMGDVGAMAEDRTLGGNTFIDVPFADSDLQTAHIRSTQMLSLQHEDLSAVLSSISDLISLEPYSPTEMEMSLEDAKQSRLDTVETVEEYDQSLVSEYELSEEGQIYLSGRFNELVNATMQGASIVPMSFNAASIEAGELYQVKDEVQQRSVDYITYKEEQQQVREAQAKQAELDARPWYEKAWDTGTVFVGEISGYYDSKRAATGIDPVTGEELSETQRATAAALAAAGFIPVVGWGGRLVKGGKAIYNTSKGVNAATHSLDAYKSTKSLSALEKSEFGIYGLVSANGMTEYITGRDLMGNELTDEQRNASLLQSTLLLGGTAFAMRGTTNVLQDMKSAGSTISSGSRHVTSQLSNATAHLSTLANRITPHNSEKAEQVVMVNGQRQHLNDVGGNPSTSSHANDAAGDIKGISEADQKKLEGWKYAPNEEKYLKYKETFDNPKYYNQETGEINWPPNDGFEGIRETVKLDKGHIIDRYGDEGGKFLSPQGVPYEQRALALHSDEMPYYRYEIIRPFNVESGVAAPWFDRLGGGTQYYTGNFEIADTDTGEMFEASVQNLKDLGYIREIE
ncbi:T7SS effector LXG polymorphic toxin [Jeotgalibacillus proteolyticus]|uniref:T7SS effector LXG polymorphic toxin n=1 Tax=Jeotgalibacillus proteolyticus TaxID=2082395 RepID=UPI003CE8628E